MGHAALQCWWADMPQAQGGIGLMHEDGDRLWRLITYLTLPTHLEYFLLALPIEMQEHTGKL